MWGCGSLMVYLNSHAPEDVRKLARLRSFELQVTCCPFFGDSSSLFFNGWRWNFHNRGKWQSQKFQNALRSGAVRRDNVFVKKNERLNLIFTKIIRPAFVVRRDAVAPFVDYLEIK